MGISLETTPDPTYTKRNSVVSPAAPIFWGRQATAILGPHLIYVAEPACQPACLFFYRSLCLSVSLAWRWSGWPGLVLLCLSPAAPSLLACCRKHIWKSIHPHSSLEERRPKSGTLYVPILAKETPGGPSFRSVLSLPHSWIICSL